MNYGINQISKIILRIYIMLSAHRGEFIYDRELGSEIHLIDKTQENAAELVEISAREALREFPYCEVKSAESYGEKIKIKMEIYGKEYDIELQEGENGIQL